MKASWFIILIGLLSIGASQVEVVPTQYIATGGVKTVSSAGTAEALGSSRGVTSCLIQAESDNTGSIYVGSASVDSTWPYLLAGKTMSLDVDNVADIWLDAEVNGDGAHFICVK